MRRVEGWVRCLEDGDGGGETEMWGLRRRVRVIGGSGLAGSPITHIFK